MQLSNLLLVVALTLPTVFARTPRNCGLACHSVKKCMAVLDGSGGNRPGQLGNTGIIVLETCAPKLAKAKKKGCTCEDELDKANDTEEANNFHAATQKSVRTSGFRIRGDQTTTETPRDNRRPSRFSSKFRSGSGSVRSGTERATASISRPALRAFRPDSTSSASFSVSSSVSTSTSSQRTPRRSLFGTTDRRRFFARRRLWKPSVVVYFASFNSQYKLFLLVDGGDDWADDKRWYLISSYCHQCSSLAISPFQRSRFLVWLKHLTNSHNVID